MKAVCALLLGATLSTQAMVIHFSLSPPGTDKAVGMSWMNEVPPPTNSTGPAIAMHIHSPAGPGTNAAVIIPLTAYSFPAVNPTNGGIIFGAVPIGTNDVANLMGGLNYINIHTTEYPGGEIRGQLVQT